MYIICSFALLARYVCLTLENNFNQWRISNLIKVSSHVGREGSFLFEKENATNKEYSAFC